MGIKFDEEVKGVCSVCFGEIKEKIISLFEIKDVYGPGSKPEHIGERTDGLVCTKCGLRYEFAPSQEVLMDIEKIRRWEWR